MKLTEKSNEVFEYVKNAGGKVTIDELVDALGRTARSVGANVTDLSKKGLALGLTVDLIGHTVCSPAFSGVGRPQGQKNLPA